MISVSYLVQKNLRRWSFQLGKTLGFHLDTKLVFILCTVIVLLIQILLHLSICSNTIYCNLPNFSSYYQGKHNQQLHARLPTIYVITPTYARHLQKAELTRLSHTFMLVPDLHWIIVEDSSKKTNLITNFLNRLKNEFKFDSITHLHAPTPKQFKLKKGEPSWAHPKGVWQRNRGLDWIETSFSKLDKDGVIYFGDDDNTYDLGLFNEMRHTRKVSVWPVGFAGGMLVERPIVEAQTQRIQGFNSMWKSERPYPIDMAGFAVSLRLFMNNLAARFSSNQKIGYVESHYLSQLVQSWNELEPKAENCSKVLVWHTKAQKPALHEERRLTKPSYSDIVDW